MPENFPPTPFQPFGLIHGLVLLSTIAMAMILCLQARALGPEAAKRSGGHWFLAFALLSAFPFHFMVVANSESIPFTWATALPMHLCNWAALAGFIALWKGYQWACELLYFWGIGGTLQGLLTPHIPVDFPHPGFFAFFHLHVSVVVAAVYLPIGLGFRPGKGAILRIWCLTQIYFVAAVAVNVFTQSNYGYLMEKPEAATLLDFLGPWPYYVLVLEGLSLLAFFLLCLPFTRDSAEESPAVSVS